MYTLSQMIGTENGSIKDAGISSDGRAMTSSGEVKVPVTFHKLF